MKASPVKEPLNSPSPSLSRGSSSSTDKKVTGGVLHWFKSLFNKDPAKQSLTSGNKGDTYYSMTGK